jgi:hypothetical protein
VTEHDEARLDRRFEIMEAVLLSLAAVLTAWAGFQATKWSGEQADGYSQAASTRVEATRSADLANQSSVADLITFTEWLAAAEREGLLADSLPGRAYVPDPDLLSGFLYQRFRNEFAVAVSAWLATSPRTNPDAPTSPFQMPEYELAAQREADRLEARADRESERAREANDISDRYVLITIMLASVLFFAGIGSKMDTYRARVLLLGMGTALLLVSAVVVASFPKDF